MRKCTGVVAAVLENLSSPSVRRRGRGDNWAGPKFDAAALVHVTSFAVTLAHTFGAMGVAAGAALEGEAAVTLGGVFARQGLFSPVACAVAASLGSFAADQLVFWLAASRRESPFVRKITAKRAFGRALRWIDENTLLFCFAFRFIYGLRIAGPAALGVSRVRFRVFVPLNLISALLWGTVFTFVGYHFGRVFENALGALLHRPHLAVEAGAALAIVLLGAVATYLWRERESAPLQNTNPPEDGCP